MSALEQTEEAGSRIEAALTEIRAAASAALLARVEGLVQELVDLYGAGLARIAEVLSADSRRQLLDDPLVGALFTLHGLHPDAIAARLESALERVRPYVASHGGTLSLVELADGTARVRLAGAHGCGSTLASMQALIERALREAAPELEAVELETVQAAAEAGLVQLGKLAKPAPGALEGAP